MKEFWMPIPGVPGYSASNLGRIRSEDRITTFYRRGGLVNQVSKGKVLSQLACSNKYLMVQPVINGKNKPRLVHRLVWSAFNGEIPNGLTINHLDKDVKNNSLGNIHICTLAENNALARPDTRQCARGHKLPPRPKVGKRKQCTACVKINWKAYYEKNGDYLRSRSRERGRTRSRPLGFPPTAKKEE